MKPKLKKGLIITISVIIAFFAILVALPFVFEGKIKNIAKNELNKTWNAKVNFDDVDISFLRTFPHVSLQFENFSFSGVGDFEKDTMINSDVVDLTLNIKSLFNDTGYDISDLQFNDSKVFFHFLPNGKFNWTDIIKEDTTAIDTTPSQFHFKLKKFGINRADILYLDEEGDVLLTFKNVNHTLTGDLTADSSMLLTRTTADSMTFSNDGFNYISNAKVEMNADIDANINDMVFKLSKNSMKINELPFNLNGWFKTVKGGIDMDFKLNAEKVDFKSILSVIPALYAESFDKIKAGGKVDLNGFLKGEFAGDYYPSFDLNLKVADGWFQYPSLPKSVEKINITAQLLNKGKTLDETIIDMSRFSFVIGGNPFTSQIRIATPMSDPDLTVKASGKIDLGMIKDVYPLEKETRLNGLLDVDLDLAGKMSYYERNQYEKFKFGGKLNVINMLLKMKSLEQEVAISKANMNFNNRFVDLTALQMKVGRNDITATGKLENAVAYALSDKTLTGSLNLVSDYFNISDFISTDSTKISADKKSNTKESEIFILPKNLDFTMAGNFKKLIYDKMNFTNVNGVLKLANGELKIQDMFLDAFGGKLKMDGLYSTVDASKPALSFDLSLNEIIFSDIFKQVETLQNFVPIFSKASGMFNTTLSFNTLLKNNMMPDLATIISNGSFKTKSVSLKDVPVLEKLVTALQRTDLLPMTLKDLGLMFEINDGNLLTKPFSFKIKDVALTLGGITGLDKSINYLGKVTLPDKLKLGQFSTYNVKITGTFAKPKIELDIKGKITEVLTTTAGKVEAEVTKKVDDAKEKALEEARKQKEKAILEAQKKADELIATADSLGNKLIEQAQKQGDNLINKATNPVAKAAAQLGAKKLVEEARKQAAAGKAKAQTEAQKLIQKASESVPIQ